MRETVMLPVRTVEGPEGVHAPFYVIPFDRSGACLAPVSRDLLARAAIDATDVFVFSHGWNADFDTAVGHYDTFIQSFLKLPGRPDRPYRPLLAGVFWPSTALTEPADGAALAELATGLTRAERATARELAGRPTLDRAEARRLAELLSALLRSEDEEPHEGPDVAPDPDALLEAGGTDPEALIQVATMLLMKDRAANVGARGVAELLLRLQATPKAQGERRIHLIGHSYGAKVMLAALSAPSARSLEVDSVLLLQPAVSSWCFAPEGTYRPALGRTRQPLVTTFSKRDEALRRNENYAVLGATGPLGVEAAVVEPAEPPTPYDFLGDLVAVRADDVIGGHDDVSSETVAWILLNQVLG